MNIIYDDQGNFWKTEYPDGSWVRYFYDQNGNILFEGYSDGKWKAWKYDGENNCIEFFDSSGYFHKDNRISKNLIIRTTSDGQTIEFDDFETFSKKIKPDGSWEYRVFEFGDQTYYENSNGVTHGTKRIV